VLVDPDPEPVVRVPVIGAAVDTDARGGGGCAAGGSAGAGAALVIALALVLGSRRRVGGGMAALLLAWIGAAAPAWAQVQASEDVDLASFRPVHGVDPTMVTVESVDVGQSGTGAVGLAFDHARNPLVLRAADGEMVDHPVSTRTTFELAGAFAFGERFEVAAVVPFLSQRGDEPQFSGIEPADGTSLGDVRLRGKALLAARDALRFGAAAELTLPTALDKQFAGVAGPSALLRGLLDYRVGRLQLAVNAGAVMRERVRLADVQQGHAAVYGAGGAVQLWSRLYAVGELFGAVDLSGGSAGNRPLEAVAALRVRATRELGLLAGVGRGLLAGVGAPEGRVFFALAWAPGARVIVAPGDDPRDMADDDGDGIVNRDDECPDEIEDVDGFRDADGCPDRDDDADGVPDLVDQCPRQPEDADGFADDDGCPDGDNDHDGLADAEDRCPNQPEDVDGFEDEDGCPDPDNDGDGIDDVADRCPAEAETINGNKDDDGCPDGGASLVIVGEDEIRTLEPIRFNADSAVLTRSSRRLLGQLGATLRAHREITRVRIRAHVHRRGDGDDELSVQRAEAVRRWLVDWGIASERLEGIGFGSRDPARSGNGPRAREANDRIILEIVERGR
jgi:outer membrane protein OmpA-like peptidoglycan-associated protein